jgi:microcystin degradation protein MlrC
MRLLIGEFSHESNSFAPVPADRESFRERELMYGAAILEAHRGRRTVLGGFIDVAERDGHELVPAIAASALPSGPITEEVYRHVLDKLIAAAEAGGRLDGVALSLHGAMAVEEVAGVLDPEGSIVSALRAKLGPNVPIAVVMDLHSDTTDLLLTNCELTLAYNEEPHRDAYDRGVEAAELIARIANGSLRPVAHREHPPLLFTGTHMATDHGPLRDLHEIRAELEKRPGVIDISIHGGFFASDQPEAGFSVVCTTDGDGDLAKALARELAAEAWRCRHSFLPAMTPIKDAIAEARRQGPTVVLVDEADDPAAGGPGDSTVLLRALLDARVPSGAITTVKDSDVARQMAEAGEGAEIGVRLGAKADDRHGRPIEATGRVVKISRAPIPSDMWSGRTYSVGIIGVLDISGVLAVVTEQKVMTENIDLLELLGIDMTTLDVVGAKGLALHIRQALAGKARAFINVDAEGVTHRDVRKLGFKRIRRPIWPLDDLPDDAYPPAR